MKEATNKKSPRETTMKNLTDKQIEDRMDELQAELGVFGIKGHEEFNALRNERFDRTMAKPAKKSNRSIYPD